MRLCHKIRLLTAAVLVSLSALPVWAHSMYQAAVLLEFHRNAVDVELQLPPSRLARATGLPMTPEALATEQPSLKEYLLARIHLNSPADGVWGVMAAEPLQWKQVDGAPYVVAHLTYAPPVDAPVRHLTLTSEVITDTIPNQVVLVSVRSDWNSSTFATEPELLGILNGDTPSIDIDRTTGDWTKGFASIFHLGVRHIAEGTDHLLFLLALLLPAPLLYKDGRWGSFAGVRHGLTQILKVVTAFTVGHSITLGLAATGLVRVPARPIEILIAFSILVSAVHAIKPLFPGRESLVAASFGLIHGLAFASTLAELGLRGWEKAGSILAFNLGIEAMQLVVVLCIMPSLMLLSRTVWYTPFRIAGALFAGTAATGWIIERVADRPSTVDAVVGDLAKHSSWFAVALLLLAVLANLLRRSGRAHA